MLGPWVLLPGGCGQGNIDTTIGVLLPGGCGQGSIIDTTVVVLLPGGCGQGSIVDTTVGILSVVFSVRISSTRNHTHSHTFRAVRHGSGSIHSTTLLLPPTSETSRKCAVTLTWAPPPSVPWSSSWASSLRPAGSSCHHLGAHSWGKR